MTVMVMVMPLIVTRLWSIEIQEILTFIGWLGLTIWLLSAMNNIKVTEQAANEFMNQVLGAMDDTFNNGDASEPGIPYNFADIGHAGDFYDWLTNTVAGVLFAGQDNMKAGEGSTLPVLDVAPVFPPGKWYPQPMPPERGANMILPQSCGLVQLRTKLVPCSGGRPHTYCVGQFTYGNEEREARPEVVERWTPHVFKNRYDAAVQAREFKGSRSGIYYPGEGGLRPAVISRLGLQKADNADGIWTSGWQTCGAWKVDPRTNKYVQEDCDTPAYSATTFEEDISHLKNKKWIDGRTSLVHLTCLFTNRNVDMNATVRYTVEFTPSGLTRPEPPFIIAYEASKTTWTLFQVPLLYGFFQFASEMMIDQYERSLLENIHENEGFKRFMPPTPHFSLHRITEAVTMFFCMVTYYWLQARQWYTPSTTQDDEITQLSVMSESDCQNSYAFNYGMITLLTCMRLIFMCDTVPRLNVIGRTLKLSFGPFVAFCAIFLILMYGFAVVFYLTYTSQIHEFDTLANTFFTLFRGMLGDMPLDEMHFIRPTETMVMYFVFCLIMLFTVFTILIAIISDAYDRVMDDKEGQELDENDAGAIALFLRGGIQLYTTVAELGQDAPSSETHPDDVDDEDEEPTTKPHWFELKKKLGSIGKAEPKQHWFGVKKKLGGIGKLAGKLRTSGNTGGADGSDGAAGADDTPIPTMGNDVSFDHPRNEAKQSNDSSYADSQQEIPSSPVSPAAGMHMFEVETSAGNAVSPKDFDPLDGPPDEIILSDESFGPIHHQDRSQAGRESRKQTWKNLKKSMNVKVV